MELGMYKRVVSWYNRTMNDIESAIAALFPAHSNLAHHAAALSIVDDKPFMGFVGKPADRVRSAFVIKFGRYGWTEADVKRIAALL